MEYTLAGEPIFVQLLGRYLVICPWLLIPGWIWTCWALQGIGRSRALPLPGLVWIPGLHLYGIGGISDYHRITRKGKEKSRRKVWLPLLRLLWILLLIPAVKLIAEGWMQYEEIVSIGASKIAAAMMLGYAFLDALWYLIPALILGLAETVIKYMALYDIFDCFEPRKKVLYLLLSLLPVVKQIAKPVILTRCRNLTKETALQWQLMA